VLLAVVFGFTLIAAVACPADPLAAGEIQGGYAVVTGPCGLTFPEDHGSHPGFRTEWWYYTGNIEAADGRSFGYQLTIFRRRISPPHARDRWPRPASAWRTQQVYLGHLAVSDIAGRKHHFSETMGRGTLGMAGQQTGTESVNIFLRDWRIDIQPHVHRLTARAEELSIDLYLVPAKDPVLHGDQGYSLKGNSAERASCYYSFTRLQTEGKISLAGKDFAVDGLSWMDHEFSTAPLQPGIVGWDWFSFQLSNNTEVMIFLLREADGGLNAASSGTFVDAAGHGRHLSIDDFRVDASQHWQSPHTQAVYPAGWRLRCVSPELELKIDPNLADQEMRTAATTGVTYWEGSVSVRGTADGEVVAGKGYVELTGYAGEFEGDL
jgi:predicted secreted hydrolase